MTVLVLFAVFFFICGLLNSYFFPPSKLLPWLCSLLPKPTKKKMKKAEEAVGPIAVGSVDLATVFSTFDRDGDGFIAEKELEESLRRLGLLTTNAEVKSMMERVDANGDGLIDLEEFRELYEYSFGGRRGGEDGGGRVGEEEMDLREAFDVFDGNRDGLITVEELGRVLKSMGLKQGAKAEDCRDMIRKVDLDGDGMVNFEEFKKMMTIRDFKLF